MKKESFGQRLSRLRKEKGLTQEDIANRITISPQAVSKWENDVSSPDIDYLNSLADILDVSVDELLGRKESAKAFTESQNEATKETKKPKEGGIYIKGDDGDQIHITKEGVEVMDENGDVTKSKNFKDCKPHPASWVVPSVVGALALIGYFLLGLLWTDANMGWSMGWILFLLVPVASSIESAIRHKKICNFAYPILVVAAYLTLGFLGQRFGFKGWEFYWFLFLTVPAFYLIFAPIDKYIVHKNNK